MSEENVSRQEDTVLNGIGCLAICGALGVLGMLLIVGLMLWMV